MNRPLLLSPRAAQWGRWQERLRTLYNTFKVRHIDTCRKQCSGCGADQDAADDVTRRHWTDRVLAQYKGGVLYAMRKTIVELPRPVGSIAPSPNVDHGECGSRRSVLRAGGRPSKPNTRVGYPQDPR